MLFRSEDGEMAKLIKAAIHGAINGIIAAMTPDAENTTDYVVDIAIAFGSGFVSELKNPLLALVISVGGETLKSYLNNDLTVDRFETILFDAASSWLLDMKIGELTESIFSVFSLYSSDSAIDVDDDFLNSIFTFLTEVTNSIIGKEVENESKRG